MVVEGQFAMDLKGLPASVSLPVCWVDQIESYVRMDIKTVTLRFFSFLPPGEKVEVARLQTTLDAIHLFAKNTIEVMGQLSQASQTPPATGVPT